VDHHYNYGDGVCYIKEMKMKPLQFHLQVMVSGLLLLVSVIVTDWVQVMFGLRLCFRCVSPCLKFVSCLFGLCLRVMGNMYQSASQTMEYHGRKEYWV
jgi:hypothetical protein